MQTTNRSLLRYRESIVLTIDLRLDENVVTAFTIEVLVIGSVYDGRSKFHSGESCAQYLFGCDVQCWKC